MPFRPANLVHTEEGSPEESTASAASSGSPEPGTRSSAGERCLHTADVVGSIPTASTILDHEDFAHLPRSAKAVYVYFVEARTLGLVKVGIARCYESRLSSLQVGSPDKLEIIGLIRPPGDPKWVEKRIHSMFSHLHAHGEWFRPSDEFRAFIAANTICERQNDWEIGQEGLCQMQGGEPTPWGPEIAAAYDRVDAAPNVPTVAGRGRRIKPGPPPPPDAPQGNSRKARMERYLLARGLAA